MVFRRIFAANLVNRSRILRQHHNRYQLDLWPLPLVEAIVLDILESLRAPARQVVASWPPEEYSGTRIDHRTFVASTTAAPQALELSVQQKLPS